MKQVLLIAASAIALAACTQTQASWLRIDGKAGTALELEQARLICEPRAEAAATAATASSPTGYGIGGAIGSGIADGINKANVRRNTLSSCMAERGFRLAQR